MMNPTHVISGAGLWLGAAALANHSGAEIDSSQIAVGAGLAAIAAYGPDIDHPQSAVARSLGPVTYLLARLVAMACKGCHQVTMGPRDRPTESGHRTLTHTLVTAVIVSVLVYLWMQSSLGPTALWLALPIGIGWFGHLLGDAMTKTGCPILWPLEIDGQRWYPVGFPKPLRFRTGGKVESVFVFRIISAATIVAGALALARSPV